MANEERKEEGSACGCGGGSCCTGPGKWIWIVLAVAVVGVLIAKNVGKKPSAASSPTTAQTLDVPISSPTMIEEVLNMLLPGT